MVSPRQNQSTSSSSTTSGASAKTRAKKAQAASELVDQAESSTHTSQKAKRKRPTTIRAKTTSGSTIQVQVASGSNNVEPQQPQQDVRMPMARTKSQEEMPPPLQSASGTRASSVVTKSKQGCPSPRTAFVNYYSGQHGNPSQ